MAKEARDENPPSERERFEFEQRKFEAEHKLAVDLRHEETASRRLEQWKSPILLAIVGGIISITGSTVASYLNSRSGQELEQRRFTNNLRIEQQKTESELIKKFLEPESEEQRLNNLKFLANSGLLPTYGDNVRIYLDENPGSLPRSLPAAVTDQPLQGNAFGAENVMDRKFLDTLVAAQVMMVTVERRFGAVEWQKCSGFFVDPMRIVTAAYCVPGEMEAGSAEFSNLRVSRGAEANRSTFEPAKVEIRGGLSRNQNAAIITLKEPAQELAPMRRAETDPRPAERLMLVYAPKPGEFLAAFDEECSIIGVADQQISYRCDASPGSGGGAVISIETGQLIAVHTYVDQSARYGVRLDALSLD